MLVVSQGKFLGQGSYQVENSNIFAASVIPIGQRSGVTYEHVLTKIPGNRAACPDVAILY